MPLGPLASGSDAFSHGALLSAIALSLSAATLSGVGRPGAAALLFFVASLALPAAALPADLRLLRYSRQASTARQVVIRAVSGALLPALPVACVVAAPDAALRASVRDAGSPDRPAHA